ncbi:MAG: GNAT family N-acetyltransferase [Candidatus Bathyarchaeota archaeon]|nr:GNAT family N-acetyltransferase [Candidatus Termiticorpusculum sp.]
MDIQIEAATLEDLRIMMAIEKQCFTSEAFSREQISYLLSDYNSISLTAKVNGEIVGFVILQLENQDDIIFGHIITLNVAVPFRRMGVAQKLLFECEAILRLRGVTECRLEVRQANYAALRLYNRLGYIEIGLLENYYGNEHGLYLKKNF